MQPLQTAPAMTQDRSQVAPLAGKVPQHAVSLPSFSLPSLIGLFVPYSVKRQKARDDMVPHRIPSRLRDAGCPSTPTKDPAAPLS